ncbi:MAG TPA: heat-inducible transcriptional repressor HrcA [Candidatus Polarisedimenticolaceae bacterium]|nr:heat-inducible transcriptional repressor HrcA [Candidatus Polarisedimenticolaceae bacterium]
MGVRGIADWSPIELGRHQADVLREIVRQYILTGEPVGSASVGRSAKLALSPASIRNVMGELESLGLLSQPHTSAGRVPTDRAYRIYVDRLIHRTRIKPEQAEAIVRALTATGGEIEGLLGEASRQLSLLSNQVGLVLAPELDRLIVDQIEFVRLDSGRVMAVLVTRSGVIHNRIIHVAEPIDPPELERIGRYITGEFGGRTLPAMRELLEQRLGQDRLAYDRAMARALELGREIAGSDDIESALFVDGASNLLHKRDLADIGVLQSLFRTLEDKKTLIDLLGRLIESRGVRVVIGEENPLADLNRCSLVASNYHAGDRVIGTLGIVGPVRMPYGRAMALVEHLSGVLTRVFSEPRN